MNKKDLVNAVAAGIVGASKSTVEAVLDTLGTVAAKHLVQPGAELTLPGIGKLKTAHKAARMGRNPKTGEDMPIAERTVVKLVVAKALKDAVA